MRSTTCSTTGSTDTGSSFTARMVSPPPHGLSRGNWALSSSSTRAPPRAMRVAVTEPAGPAPTTMTSKRSKAFASYASSAHEIRQRYPVSRLRSSKPFSLRRAPSRALAAARRWQAQRGSVQLRTGGAASGLARKRDAPGGKRGGGGDSNLRRLSRRFYRPLPLAARAHPLARNSVVSLFRRSGRHVETHGLALAELATDGVLCDDRSRRLDGRHLEDVGLEAGI